MKRRMIVVVSSLFVIGIIGFVALGAGNPRERQVKDGVRITAYSGGGRVLRTSAGEWTLEFNDSGAEITFSKPVVAFTDGQLPIDEPFEGRIHFESLDRVAFLTLFTSDHRIIYEAVLRLDEDDATQLIQTLGGRPATAVEVDLYDDLLRAEGDDVPKLIQRFRRGPVATAVPQKEALTAQAKGVFDSRDTTQCPGGSCTLGPGKCSACCPAGKTPSCKNGGMMDRSCTCVVDTTQKYVRT